MTFEEIERDPSHLDQVDIIYPACDVDLFAYSDALGVLRRAASLGRSISISTKVAISEPRVEQIASIAAQMRAQGHVLKISTSFSTKKRIKETEPGTADYPSRMRTLGFLSRSGVVTSLVLKPIRADVPVDEYCEILVDAMPYTTMILLGEEYLDENVGFAITPEVAGVSSRPVSWIPGQPEWPVKAIPDHLRAITAYGSRLGFNCFLSDLELMQYAIRAHSLLGVG